MSEARVQKQYAVVGEIGQFPAKNARKKRTTRDNPLTRKVFMAIDSLAHSRQATLIDW
jgi:hypothetical protein